MMKLNVAVTDPYPYLTQILKHFTKIIANRLAPHRPELIENNQVGFIHGREARDGIIRA